ncbi:diguanylate cyclase [Ramlibacter sp. 2FC]|uniref:diguanylate cyclase n=1 Tax=Ramlibacter sp. 2FC TaxID=2502188 RepID=UPI0010F7F1EF|nr:diguanylate cyclase [Ramlibacter sp. 2FC]
MKPIPGIRTRLWLAAALPAMLTVLLLLLLFHGRQGSALEDALRDRAHASARQLGSAAEFLLFADNRDGLARLVESAMAVDPNMRGVAIYALDGRLQAAAGRLSTPLPAFDDQVQVRVGKALTVVAPIYPSALPADELYAPLGAGTAAAGERRQGLGHVVLEFSLDAMAGQQRDLLLWALITAAGGLLLAGLFSTWIASSVTRPIGHISRVVERMREGELEARADPAASGVLRALAAGINTMAARVAMTQEELRQQIAAATDELRRQKEAAEQAARIDPLTGVASRRAFTEVAEVEIQRALRYRSPLSLVIIDLDHFKAVNDTHGHVTGDAVLVSIAQTVAREAREVDLVARLGGEEFVVLLPNCAAEQAALAAERMRLAIEQSKLHVEGRQLSYSASFGVAQFDPSELSITRLLARADAALYQAKTEGRNRVAVAQA